jgi:hypothetical protein
MQPLGSTVGEWIAYALGSFSSSHSRRSAQRVLPVRVLGHVELYGHTGGPLAEHTATAFEILQAVDL